jgi:hypothetical protein
MNIDLVAKDLEDIITSSDDLISIPYVKGNSIRIKNYAIRKSKNKYIIFDCKENRKIVEVNFKVSAISIAKTLSEKNDFKKTIEMLDKKLLKHYNDILFYKNIIKKTNSRLIRETRKARLEISLQSANAIQNQLADFVFGDK